MTRQNLRIQFVSDALVEQIIDGRNTASVVALDEVHDQEAASGVDGNAHDGNRSIDRIDRRLITIRGIATATGEARGAVVDGCQPDDGAANQIGSRPAPRLVRVGVRLAGPIHHTPSAS